MEQQIVDIVKEYAEGNYHLDITEHDLHIAADRIVKLFAIPDVSNRRELLIAYGEWIHELAGCKDTEKATTLADSYLSNL